MNKPEPCGVCQEISEYRGATINGTIVFHVICPRCGQYQIDYVAKAYLNVQLDPTKVAVLSHAIRKMQRTTDIPMLDQPTVARILQNPLPKPTEQQNSFILWLGDNSPGLGEKVDIDGLILQAEIGARTQDGVRAIANDLVERNFVKLTKLAGTMGEWFNFKLELKMAGWEYYENLKRGSYSSRKAFMAMKYGDLELDDVVAKYIRPAVQDTGFNLYRLDDAPKAGLIDDRLRVEIRTSRFLIADLTHENAGAYWEAGFAEGLGKPVIYTCEKNKFNERKTHFDTNHHTTVLWDRDNLDRVSHDLKNTIRATLPDEAKLIDED